MAMGMQWQVNKNVCIKGRASLDTVACGLAFKSWWDPTATVAFSATYDYKARTGGYGFKIKLENLGRVLYSRGDKGAGFEGQTLESRASKTEVKSESRASYEDDPAQAEQTADLYL